MNDPRHTAENRNHHSYFVILKRVFSIYLSYLPGISQGAYSDWYLWSLLQHILEKN